MTNELQASAIVAMAATYGFELLKRAPWFPWVQVAGGRLNAYAGAAVAALSSLGIHVAYDGAAGSLLITGLTLTGAAAALLEFGRQWLFQQFIFDTAIRRAPDAPSA
jgi:hypothetical protein